MGIIGHVYLLLDFMTCWSTHTAALGLGNLVSRVQEKCHVSVWPSLLAMAL